MAAQQEAAATMREHIAQLETDLIKLQLLRLRLQLLPWLLSPLLAYLHDEFPRMGSSLHHLYPPLLPPAALRIMNIRALFAFSSLADVKLFQQAPLQNNRHWWALIVTDFWVYGSFWPPSLSWPPSDQIQGWVIIWWWPRVFTIPVVHMDGWGVIMINCSFFARLQCPSTCCGYYIWMCWPRTMPRICTLPRWLKKPPSS